MKKRLRQKGFTVIEGLLLIVLLAALAFGGWYVWKQQDKATNDNENTSETQNTSLTETKNAEITELGVKINDPDNKELAIKKVDVTSPLDGSVASYYTVTPAGYVSSVCETPAYVSSATEEEALANGASYKKIGDSYFYVGGTIGGCGDDTLGWQEYITELKSYIYDNLTSIND